MAFRKVATFVVLSLVAVAFGWYGCSDNTIETIVSADDLNNTSQSEVLNYFPLNEGYTTVFSIAQSNGSHTTASFRVGKTVDFLGMEVVEWIGTQNGVIDTGYFRVTENSLIYYDNYYTDPEVILDLPFQIGASWLRFDDQSGTDAGDSYIDISSGTEDDGGGGAAKVFPTDGASAMVIDGYESINLDNGFYYAEVLRVANATSNGLGTNYYWYSPGIGLIRYALGVTDATYPDGVVTAELINYFK